MLSSSPMKRFTDKAAAGTGTSDSRSEDGLSRRALLQKLALAVCAVPFLRFGETVARAERHRRRHRGDSNEMWIGHC